MFLGVAIDNFAQLGVQNTAMGITAISCQSLLYWNRFPVFLVDPLLQLVGEMSPNCLGKCSHAAVMYIAGSVGGKKCVVVLIDVHGEGRCAS